MKDVQQLSEDIRTMWIGLIAYFVAGAPKHHRWMVPVAVDEVLYVPLVPFVEIIGVAVGADLALAHFPLIERLVHHEETHAVAQIQKLGGIRVMTGADGVATHFAQDFQTT